MSLYDSIRDIFEQPHDHIEVLPEAEINLNNSQTIKVVVPAQAGLHYKSTT